MRIRPNAKLVLDMSPCRPFGEPVLRVDIHVHLKVLLKRGGGDRKGAAIGVVRGKMMLLWSTVTVTAEAFLLAASLSKYLEPLCRWVRRAVPCMSSVCF